MSVIIQTGATDPTKPILLYQNVFEEGSIIAAEGTTPLNAIEDTTFDFWQSTANPQSIAVDMTTDTECDCVGVAAHSLASDGASFRVQYSADNVTWMNAIVAVSPLTDATFVVKFDAVTARYWRVRIINANSTIGVVKLGKALTMQDGVLSGHVAINHANRIDLLTNNSIGGQFLGNRIKTMGADTDINFGLVDTAFLENSMAVFEDHFNKGRGFFYAGAPVAFPDDCGYCWRNGDEMRPSYDEGGTLANVSIGVSVYNG